MNNDNKKESDETFIDGTKVTFTPSKDLIGKQFGDYKIIKEIGHGGMAAVYESYQISLDRKVAIKIIPKTLTEEPQYLERFKREAKGAANLNHQNIVSIHGFGKFDDTHYYVMDLVRGKTLYDLIEEKKKDPLARARKFNIKEALEIIEQAANALSYAHSQSIIHRDIKPSNLFIDDKTQRVLITDFGLAKSQKWEKITPRASLFGTPAYMSPEQAQGKSLDNRTDIYSLGAVLYEMLTGIEPYIGDNALEVIEKVKSEPITPPSKHNLNIPPEVEAIILKAISKDIWLRYQSMDEFLKDIELFLKGEKITTFTQIAKQQLEEKTPIDKRKIWFVLTLIVGISIVIGVGLFWYFKK